MRLTWRDAAATLLVGAATAVYIGQTMGAPIPLITDRGDVAAAALLLGFVACVIDEWTVTHAVLVRTLSVFSVCTLAVGIAAMATESEALLTVVVAMLVTLWAVTTLAHAGVIAQRANSDSPHRRAVRPRPHRFGA
jgi:steroid 5-alpha reductase family enzyme